MSLFVPIAITYVLTGIAWWITARSHYGSILACIGDFEFSRSYMIADFAGDPTVAFDRRHKEWWQRLMFLLVWPADAIATGLFFRASRNKRRFWGSNELGAAMNGPPSEDETPALATLYELVALPMVATCVCGNIDHENNLMPISALRPGVHFANTSIGGGMMASLVFGRRFTAYTDDDQNLCLELLATLVITTATEMAEIDLSFNVADGAWEADQANMPPVFDPENWSTGIFSRFEGDREFHKRAAQFASDIIEPSDSKAGIREW